MVDLAAAGTAVATLKGAFDLTKTVLDVQGTVKIQSKVIELQSQILAAQQSAMSAQQAQTTLLDRIKELEAEIARLKQWDTDQAEYQLEQIGTGGFAYTPKAEPTPTKPNYWLCVNCFDRSRQRSVLQAQGRTKDDSQSIWACPACKASINVHWNASPRSRRVVEDEFSDTPTVILD
jgi:rubrerythrin